MIDKKNIRDVLRLLSAITFSPLYYPHLLFCLFSKNRNIILKDVETLRCKHNVSFASYVGLLYFLHVDRFFRTLFYHRIGPVGSLIIGWWKPGDRYFVVSKTTKIGAGAYFAHSFSTEINAKSIGKNFSCRHLTTIGNKRDGDNEKRPVIGDNVTLGVNVTIIGPVTIGNNVIIGAGSVVVKDVPDNCVVAGNPAKIIKTIP